MKKLNEKRSAKVGMPPGSYVYVGQKRVEQVKISAIDYDQQQFNTAVLNSIDETEIYRSRETISWINIDGLHDTSILEKIGLQYEINPLTIEDILNTHQRPKIEIFDHYILIILKMLNYKNNSLQTEQVSMILGKNFLLTFQETEGDLFDPVRARIKNSMGRIRKSGADYLAYALMDVIVDNYFIVIESIGEEIENLEDKVLKKPTDDLVEKIHFLKRKILYLRRSVYPLRESITTLQQSQPNLVKKSTRQYIRDLYEHTIQIIDAIESTRDIVTSLLDLYMSSMSIKMNEVMKVLTIIATIFIPLSFLAGVYGMNFDTGISPFNMPELEYRYGYLLFWFLTFLVAAGFMLFFKKKKWI
ncbi:MAG: magnesium/cobalt transporter CorA [Calditrichae bacterium]|nr:magnesium/cobalt transporter CorA [Calditrichota bacterium]MCB9058417.1 magnesium/cobalt transporter CorA [Calditrichia bacterium]